MVFWHPKGWATFQEIISYMRRALKNNAYLEVAAPQIISKVLWEKSGHWQKFRDNMFTTSDADNNIFCVKPMNCPGHILIYNQGLKSYRDLPLKYGEFGICHRNECSGTLHGLMRIRQFTQDDAHVFCTEEQIQDEVSKLIDLVYKTYKDFGFSEIIVKLATRPEERIGEDYVWDLAEQALEIALNNKNISWMLSPGEGAFYGPKIELSLKDSLDRVWQLGTIQVDFSMPERLGAQYVAEDGSKKTPVMIHRAILGSIERYVGILLEHYAGALPLWLSPVQVVVMNITDNQADYAKQIADDLRKQGFRVEADIRNEKVGFKIRWHTMQKIPYLFIVGDREKQDGTVSVRKRSGEDIGSMLLKDISEKLRADVDNYK
jgi:threonyl-tRNA synthetase